MPWTIWRLRWLNNWIDENPKPDGEKFNIYLDGLKVYTTIDSRMQKNAEEAVEGHMKRLQAEFFVQNTPSNQRVVLLTSDCALEMSYGINSGIGEINASEDRINKHFLFYIILFY